MQLSNLETDQISSVVIEHDSFRGKEYLVTIFDHVLNEDEAGSLLGSYALAMSNKDEEQMRRYMPAESNFSNFFRKIFASYTFYRGSGEDKFSQYLTLTQLWQDVEYSLRKETRLWVYIKEANVLLDGNYDCCLVAYRFRDSPDEIFSSLVEKAKDEGVFFLFSKNW